MHITFDPTKNERNIRERGLSFEAVAGFDFDSALVWVDERNSYGETRFVAIGWLHGTLARAVFHRNCRRHPCDQPAQSQSQRGPSTCQEPDR